MNWIALLPIKQGAQIKSRLAGTLSFASRYRLADGMARIVIDALHGAPSIKQVRVLSIKPPSNHAVEWEPDRGSGLNAELQRVRDRLARSSVLVLHGDLPLLTSCDVEAICQEAGHARVAIAPDRHRQGSNAVALPAGTPFNFVFGPGSFARHVRRAAPHCAIVKRLGFEIDVDTPDDLHTVNAILASSRFIPARDVEVQHLASERTQHAG